MDSSSSPGMCYTNLKEVSMRWLLSYDIGEENKILGVGVGEVFSLQKDSTRTKPMFQFKYIETHWTIFRVETLGMENKLLSSK